MKYKNLFVVFLVSLFVVGFVSAKGINTDTSVCSQQLAIGPLVGTTLSLTSSATITGPVMTTSHYEVSDPTATMSRATPLMYAWSVDEGGVTDIMQINRYSTDPREVLELMPMGAMGSDTYAEVDIGTFKNAQSSASLGVNGNIGIGLRPTASDRIVADLGTHSGYVCYNKLTHAIYVNNVACPVN